jgi:Lar family restriction alleviation protein
MSRNAFDLSEREYNEREDYMANRKEERRLEEEASKTVIDHCPFCGHDDVEVDEIEIGIIAICCPECLTIGPHQDGAQSVELAIEKWNRRK